MEYIKTLASERFDYMISIRRELHQYPELSFQEFQTASRIKRELDKFGIPYQSVAKTGIIAKIVGSLPGKTIALRADMDALEIDEGASKSEFRSKNKNVMHACGHDLHMAALLGAAKILLEQRDQIQGTVLLIFQPAEERVAGAKAMLSEAPFLRSVDEIFGVHIMPEYPAGQVFCRPEGLKLAGEGFTIHVEGVAGHGAMPHEAVDALLAGSAIVLQSQYIISHEIDPKDPAVLTICTMQAGTRSNVIAGQAELSGTFRAYSKEMIEQIRKSLTRVAETTAQTYGATATVEYQGYVPPVWNDANLHRLVTNAAEKICGPENVQVAPICTAGDDFSFYTEYVPGYYLLVGCGNRNGEIEPTASVHTPDFWADESCLPVMAGCYAQVAIDFLSMT